jgi:hypothetical protein
MQNMPIHHILDKIPTLGPILNQINPVHTLSY